jgi:protein arginine kinase
MDNQLESKLTYAFSPRLGYLTSCPSNVGTGMRASVMLHLPGLVFMEEMDPVINGISKIGLAVRGMWGEGTEAAGNMFQISNQSTLGRREDEIIAHLEQIVSELIEHETHARQRLMQDRAPVVEDHVARAIGILSSARMMTSAEALNLLSTLRLGLDLGLEHTFSQRAIDTLFIAIQPAHLQKMNNKDLDPDDRDVVRAEMLRDFMKNATSDNDLD